MIKRVACLLLALILWAVPAMAVSLTVAGDQELQAQYTFELEGVKYRLPTPMSALYENGWSHTSPAGSSIAGTFKPHTYGISSVWLDEKKIGVTVFNGTDAPLPVTECTLVGVDVSSDSGAAFSMENGLSFGASPEQIVAACGLSEPQAEKLKARESLMFDFSLGDAAAAGVVSQAAPGQNGITLYLTQPFEEADSAVWRITLERFPG